MTVEHELESKFNKLKELLSSFGKVVVAFSGGVDSTFLAAIAYRLLKENAVAITIASPLVPSQELEEAIELAQQIGIQHHILTKESSAFSWFVNNPMNRCYLCKKSSLQAIQDFCRKEGISGILIEGSNYDDVSDFRPGMRAIKELQAHSPLLEVQLTKKEIRTLAKKMAVPVWDKPSSPCLATRFPFGETITEEKLEAVFSGEKFLRALGFEQVRLRVHGFIARIEVKRSQLEELIKKAETITQKLKELGFKFITLDLEGYQTGSMNINKQ